MLRARCRFYWLIFNTISLTRSKTRSFTIWIMIWLVNKNDIRLLTCDNLHLFSININRQKIRPSLREIGEMTWITYAWWSPGETPRLDLKKYRIMQIAWYCAIFVSDKKNVLIYQGYKYSLVVLLMQNYPFSKPNTRRKVVVPPNKQQQGAF